MKTNPDTPCVLAVLTVIAMLTAGCGDLISRRSTQPKPDEPATQTRPAQPVEAPETPPVQAKAPEPKPPTPVMAYVNNQPIYMERLHSVLVEAHGMRYAKQLIVNELVRQEAKARGVTVTAEDVEAEHERTLRETFPSVANATQRRRLLVQMLQKRDMPRSRWDATMRRNALVRKMVPVDIPVSDAEMQRAFDRRYGRQVVVRHIQTNSLTKAQQLLSRLEAGADFAQVAGKESTNETARDGGLLPAFGPNSKEIPPALREAAFALKVGELSNPVQVGTAFHVLKLERVIQPADVTFEKARSRLFVEVRQAKARAIQQKILDGLITRAARENRVTYVDPVLRAQSEKGARP